MKKIIFPLLVLLYFSSCDSTENQDEKASTLDKEDQSKSSISSEGYLIDISEKFRIYNDLKAQLSMVGMPMEGIDALGSIHSHEERKKHVTNTDIVNMDKDAAVFQFKKNEIMKLIEEINIYKEGYCLIQYGCKGEVDRYEEIMPYLCGYVFDDSVGDFIFLENIVFSTDSKDHGSGKVHSDLQDKFDNFLSRMRTVKYDTIGTNYMSYKINEKGSVAHKIKALHLQSEIDESLTKAFLDKIGDIIYCYPGYDDKNFRFYTTAILSNDPRLHSLGKGQDFINPKSFFYYDRSTSCCP